MPEEADRELEELRHAACWEPNLKLPSLTDAERNQVHARIDDLCSERLARIEIHRERIERTARWLGREVAAYRLTLTDADARLDRVVSVMDSESEFPHFLVPIREGLELARTAFQAAFETERRNV
jgi:hypothetical protein